MPFILDGIEIKIDGDLSGFTKSLKSVEKAATAVGKTIQSKFSGVNKTIKSMGATIKTEAVGEFKNLSRVSLDTSKKMQRSFSVAEKTIRRTSKAAAKSAKEIQKGFNGVERSIKKVNKQMKKTAPAAKKASRSIKDIVTSRIGLAAIVLSLALMARKAIQVADSMNRVTIRIKAILGPTADVVRIQNELFETSQKTGTALNNTLQLFQRFTLTKATLGATNDQLLQLTENVQSLGVLGGTGAEQVRFATVQLTQALNNGTLQAQELNSILEGAPLIARAIEKGMGLLPGTLKRAVIQGTVLSKDVFGALLSVTKEVKLAIAGLPIDLERASIKLDNATSRIIATFEKRTGFVASLAKTIEKIAISIAPTLEEDIERVTRRIKLLKNTLEERIADNAGTLFNFMKEPTEGLKGEIAKNIAELDMLLLRLDERASKKGEEPAAIIKISKETIKALDEIKKLETQLNILQATSVEGKLSAKFGLKETDELVTKMARLNEAIQAITDSQQQKNDLDREAAQLIKDHSSETDKLLMLRERQEQLLPVLIALLGDETKAREILARSTEKQAEKITKTIDLTNAFGSAAEGAFERAIFSGRKFSKMLQGLAQDIARIFIRQKFIKPLVGALFPSAKAGGGNIQGPTLVGERGPEIFIPSTTGKIVNNSGAKSMMGAQQPNFQQTIVFDTKIEKDMLAMIFAAAPFLQAATMKGFANSSTGKNF